MQSFDREKQISSTMNKMINLYELNSLCTLT